MVAAILPRALYLSVVILKSAVSGFCHTDGAPSPFPQTTGFHPADLPVLLFIRPTVLTGCFIYLSSTSVFLTQIFLNFYHFPTGISIPVCQLWKSLSTMPTVKG